MDFLRFLCSFFQFPVWIYSCFGSRDETRAEVQQFDSEEVLTDEYDVFLSFRGFDTRQGFTDVLYHTMDSVGIRIFRDDDEISIGEPIRKIFRAIEISQICVPVFSKNFASSSWCLNEVAKMMELHKDDNVVPIFYDVTPDDVKLKTRTFQDFLKKHAKKYGKDQVKKWEDALKAAAGIKGKEVLNTRHVEFCKQLVDEILSKLKPRKKYDVDHLVGMDNQIESVMKLLDIESSDIRYIGIHGMGGVGKTTLAKAVFNEILAKFDRACFLEDIRERSTNGFMDLQKQLQESLDPKFGRGSGFSIGIEERFHAKKVLIVLDDVDKWEQIQKLAGRSDWFGSGSRIIVTTRDVKVLNPYGKLQEDEVRHFETSTLEYNQALQLFSWYAFRGHPPPAMFQSFAEEIVSTAGGLPLALKVMGSLLYKNKDENAWREIVSRSRKIPIREVKERLKISFDALEYDHKKIFLDIACLPIGEEKANAFHMWEASGLYPRLGVERLNSMSLVKITDDNRIWMHDQLRDLGKDIVCEESREDPGNRSRIWEIEDAWKVLTNKEGQGKIEALCAEKHSNMTLSCEHFLRFGQLRFLKLAGANIEGDFNNLLPKLAWLSWHLCPPSFDATYLRMEKLAVLDLSFSLITDSWGGWSLIQNPNQLKVLDLSNCHELTRTPEFSEKNCLKRLILRGCSKLRNIHGSIGKLKSLQHLDLDYCYSLNGLPEEIGSLENLEELVVRGYGFSHGQTFNLPGSIGSLKSLLILRLECLNIIDVPDEIGGLAKLEHLSLLGCHKVKRLPASLGDLESLTELNLQHCPIEELPDTLGHLQNLKVLNIGDCNIKNLPASIGMMKKLEVLDAYCNRQLKEVPVELGMLSSLRELNLGDSSISTLPSTISQLSHLRNLYLLENAQLQELPDLPLSLTVLRVSSPSLLKVPDLSKLSDLTELSLFTVKNFSFEGIDKLTKLKYLGLIISDATALGFDLASLVQLKTLHFVFGPVYNSSKQAGSNLPDLSSLKNLSVLAFYNCFITEGLQELGLRELEKLETVLIHNSVVELIEVCLLKNLKALRIWESKLFKILPEMSFLKNLQQLHIEECEELVEIPGLGKLKSLSGLWIEKCNSLERLENLSEMKKLSVLVLKQCPKLRSIQGTDRLSFSTLVIDECDSICNVDDLKKRSNKGFINGLRFENFI